MEGIIASGLQTMGAILIGITALGVHHRILHDKIIDDSVVSFMKVEQKIGIFGILLLASGFALEVHVLFV